MWQSAYAASAVRVLNPFKPAEERSPGAIVHTQQDPFLQTTFAAGTGPKKPAPAGQLMELTIIKIS